MAPSAIDTAVHPSTAVIVVAAGSGTRLGRPEPKAFVELAGRAILGRSLDAIWRLPEPVQVIVVAPSDLLAEAGRLVAESAGVASDYCTVVAGGSTRQESVAAGLAALTAGIDVVLVHDAARVFTPTSQFDAVITAVRDRQHGIVPGLAVSDTIKRVDADGAVTATVDRSELSAVQTPQGFPRAALVAAYAAASEDVTDDAGLFASAGGTVSVIPGDALAFKVTTPWDLRRAEQLLADDLPTPAEAAAAAPTTSNTPRTGIGFDVHAFDDDSPLWLAGLHWPGERGLAGHSDGDAVAHAVCDALLSAAGLGDIGTVFGTSDPRFDGAHGDVFLAETVRMLGAAGFRVGNVSVQIVGNRPRFSPRKAEAESLLTELIGAPVSISATTTDALGFTGRGEGIAAVATAVVIPASDSAR